MADAPGIDRRSPITQPLNESIWQEACFIFEEQKLRGRIFAGWTCCFLFPPLIPLSWTTVFPHCSRFPCSFHSYTHRLHISAGKLFWCANGKPIISGESESDAFRTLPALAVSAGTMPLRVVWVSHMTACCANSKMIRLASYFPFLKTASWKSC